MKTKIITLESHDDLISVRDKLSWAKTPRILLVWPKYADVTLRILDLKVLQRHADSLGAQLGLVTRVAKVKRDAVSLGMPVFKSTALAQRDAWIEPAARVRQIPRPPRRDLRALRESVTVKESAWRTSLLGRIITFTLGVIAVLALAISFLPRATITVYPETKIQSVKIPIMASELNTSVSITGAIPAQKLLVTVSAEQTLALVNTISVPKSKSQGIARFVNLSQGEINIPAGTIISTGAEPRIRFITLHDTLFGVDNKFVDVPIEAAEAGASGNVAADKIKTVEGLLGLSLTVTNPEALSGGVDVQQIGADEDDRAALRQTTLDNLRRAAETKMRAQLAPADILALDTFEIANIVDETFTPAAGMPSKTLTLNMQVEFSAQTISATDLNQLALDALNASVSPNFNALGEAKLKIIDEAKTDSNGTTHFDIEIARTLIRQIDTTQVFLISRGYEISAAKDILTKKLALRQASDIIIKPSWWRWLPLIPFNVAVETK